MSEYDMYPLPSSSQTTTNRQAPADPAPQAAVPNPPHPMPALHPGLQPAPPPAIAPPAANQGAQVNRLPVLATGAKRAAPDTGFEQAGADDGKRARTGEAAAEANTPPAPGVQFAWVDGDVNAGDGNGDTALMRAAKAGDVDLLPVLLAVPGIEVNAKDRDGWTALHMAARNGHVAIVRELVDAPGIDVNIKTGNESTTLHLAAENGHAAVVEVLGNADDIDVNAWDGNGWTALHRVAMNGRAEVMEVLLDIPDIDVTTTDGGWSVLHAAAEHGHAALIPALVAWPGINVNAEDADGWTALHQAAAEGHAAVVWTLAAVPDFDVNATVGGDCGTALHIAAEYGRVEAVQAPAAVPHFDVNAKDDDGRTSLHTAAEAGEAAVLQVLIAIPGVEVNARDDCNCTALHLAAKRGHAAVVQLLLAVPGIDIDVRNNMGQTPLVSADGSACLLSAKEPDCQQIQRALKRHRAPEAAVSSAIRELLQRLCSSDAPPRSQAASTTSNAVATSTSTSASVANTEVMQGIIDSLQSGKSAASEVAAQLRSIGGFPQRMQELIAQSLALGFFCGHYRNADGSVDAAIESALNDTGLQHPCAEAIKTLAAVPNINLCHVDGMNLLGIAGRQGNARMVRALVRLGALVNLPSPNGATALAIAVKQRQWGACAELIAHGALPMLPDAGGHPVLYYIVADFCSDAHCSEALALLIRYIRLKGISFDIPVRNPEETARAEHPTVLLSDLLANGLMSNPELLVRYGHLLLSGASEQPQAATLPH